MLEIEDEFDPPFEAIEPAQCRGPLLFNSPHSGRVYPREFLLASRLDLATLRQDASMFDGVREFADVSGERIVGEKGPRARRDTAR